MSISFYPLIPIGTGPVISQTAEYALRAAAALAHEPQACLTTHRIATLTHVPPDYLAKVLQLMSRAGLVHAQRGLHGGFRLARDPQHVTLLEIVRAIENPPRYIREDHANHNDPEDPDTLEELSTLHQHMDDALKSMEQHLHSTTLAMLTQDPIRPSLDGEA